MSLIFKAFRDREQSLRRIIAKYRPNPDDVDELTQETFLKGFAAELEKEIHEPEHFLMRVAKNLAINSAQRKTNSAALSVEDIGGETVLVDESSISGEDRLYSQQKLFVLTKGLASLSPEMKEAFIMRRIEGLRYKQIATRLNVSVSTVEKRVASAMMDIYAYIREQGLDPADFSGKVEKTVTVNTNNRTHT